MQSSAAAARPFTRPLVSRSRSSPAMHILCWHFKRWRARCVPPQRLALLLITVSRSVGVPCRHCCRSGWECESQVDLAHYHRSKTGALFAAAAIAGAAAAGAESEPWRMFVANNWARPIRPRTTFAMRSPSLDEIGKQVRRDPHLGRPTVVRAWTCQAAIQACLSHSSAKAVAGDSRFRAHAKMISSRRSVAWKPTPASAAEEACTNLAGLTFGRSVGTSCYGGLESVQKTSLPVWLE
jgi:hypothetical protein